MTASRASVAGSHSSIAVLCARVPAVLPSGTITRLIEALPEQRKSSFARRSANATGMESVTGLALLASLSSTGRIPPLRCLQWTSRGKPWLPDGPDFSITHSAGIAACAVAPPGLAIGIDIESVGRARNAAIGLVASDEERIALESGGITATELWTAKEAVLKAAGAGLADIGQVRVHDGRARFAGVAYYVQSFPLTGDVLLTVAMEQHIPVLKIDWPSPFELFGFHDEYNQRSIER
jgi:phosphopantetheinyl transferase